MTFPELHPHVRMLGEKGQRGGKIVSSEDVVIIDEHGKISLGRGETALPGVRQTQQRFLHHAKTCRRATGEPVGPRKTFRTVVDEDRLPIVQAARALPAQREQGATQPAWVGIVGGYDDGKFHRGLADAWPAWRNALYRTGESLRCECTVFNRSRALAGHASRQPHRRSYPVLQAAGDHRARTNDATIADRDAAQHGHTRPQPDIAADDDR